MARAGKAAARLRPIKNAPGRLIMLPCCRLARRCATKEVQGCGRVAAPAGCGRPSKRKRRGCARRFIIPGLDVQVYLAAKYRRCFFEAARCVARGSEAWRVVPPGTEP